MVNFKGKFYLVDVNWGSGNKYLYILYILFIINILIILIFYKYINNTKY